ncbi:MAG: hypothetical protein MZV64_12075 [Ignavibacteriales bacterium]|nr:hypothetical protein [Ignavibacteriales bacterium]
MEMFTTKDQPTDPFTPILAEYKGKIYPMNMVTVPGPEFILKGNRD